MTIWLLAIGLVLVFGSIGFFKGSIRMAVAVVGLILGVMLAVPFGPMLWSLMPKIGVKNPVWVVLLPPAVVFIIVNLAFISFSFWVHHKVAMHYKYKRDDIDRLRWERVNRRAGASTGVLVGVVFFFLICGGVIYPGGYITTQMSSEENSPSYIKWLNNARREMAEMGLDKAVVNIDPATPRFYQAADVLGLLYHNPLLQARLANYPYYLSLGARPEFQEMATDKEYNDLIFGKAPVNEIIKHPRTEALMATGDLMDYLKGTDFADLREYLKTGKSAKYAEHNILGVWALDKDAVFTNLRKMNPDIKSRELATLRKGFELIPAILITAMPDQKVLLKADAVTAPPPTEPAPEPDPVAARYGMPQRAPAAAPGVPAAPQPAPAANPLAGVPTSSGEGTWKEEAGRYIISLPLPTGMVDVPATIKGDEMVLEAPQMPLVFIKQEV